MKPDSELGKIVTAETQRTQRVSRRTGKSANYPRVPDPFIRVKYDVGTRENPRNSP
jgi:hypothetical protein